MMSLEISQLIPLPLLEQIPPGGSDVWLCTWRLEQGEKVLVRAPSGSGKTTLMHILYGLRDDYDGTVAWEGAQLRGISSETLARLRAETVSMIFQDLRLFPSLTARENIELKRALTNTVSAEEVAGWMSRLGIDHRRNAPVHTLSYGEQQRVAIIRALLQPFCWLLADEPFSHLDEANTRAAAALIDEVVQRHGAGLLLAELDGNDYFQYTKKLKL
jgi:ABC-type lipoprotein export system ATPase subunit